MQGVLSKLTAESQRLSIQVDLLQSLIFKHNKDIECETRSLLKIAQRDIKNKDASLMLCDLFLMYDFRDSEYHIENAICVTCEYRITMAPTKDDDRFILFGIMSEFTFDRVQVNNMLLDRHYGISFNGYDNNKIYRKGPR